MKNPRNNSTITKREIGKHTHTLINEGNLQEAERFLLQLLEDGNRSTVVLGSLINLYKIQGERWTEIEELAREYLHLKPNNSFAQDALDFAVRMQRKIKKQKQKPKRENRNTDKDRVRNFRKQIYSGSISIENIPEEQLNEFSEFERNMLLAELYSHSNLPTKAKQLLKQAGKKTGITQKERKIVAQALQIANSNKMSEIQRKKEWEKLEKEQR